MGKLEDGQLVGDESDDDVTEEARAIVELLSRGEVTNVGPQPNIASSSRVRIASQPQPIASGSADSLSAATKSRSKVSKFKLNIAQAGRRDSSPPISPSFPTPQMNSDRSSPKLSSPSPLLVPTPTPRHAAGRPHVADVDIPESIRRRAAHGQMPSMIVDSPSFRSPHAAQMPGMIVESPSFNSSASSATLRPSMPSMIVESPDFPPPASTRIASTTQPIQIVPRSMSTPLNRSTAGTRRPGMVMEAEVKESFPSPRRGEVPEQGGTKRVSKFKAERV